MASRAISSVGLKSQFGGDNCAAGRRRCNSKQAMLVRAQQQEQQQQQQQQRSSSSRRAAMFGLMAAAGVLTAAKESQALTGIKVNEGPPPFGGLPGTENADQARDLDLNLKERFFIQPLSPAEAVNRIKDASKDIVGVKDLIAKKSWPYVRNDLRNKATYLRYDLNTILSAAKSKDERKEIKKLSSKLFDTLDKLDFAARSKDPAAAEKSYAETVAALDTVIAKISA